MAKAAKRPSAVADASNALFVYVFGALLIALAIGQAVIGLLEWHVSRNAAPAAPMQRSVLTNDRDLVMLVQGYEKKLLAFDSYSAQLRGGSASASSAFADGPVFADTLDVRKPLPGPNEAWPFGDSVREAPYPIIRSQDMEETVPLSAVNARAAKEQEQAVASARKAQVDGKGKDVVVSEEKSQVARKNDGPATTGMPCWPQDRALLTLGLDSQGEEAASDDTLPLHVRRSRVPHARAQDISRTACTFHSTPTGGGLQCCCAGEESVPGIPSSFFCIPGLVLAGARHSGVGQLWAHLHGHGYLVSDARAQLDHAFQSVHNHKALDGIIPRLSVGMSAHAAALGVIPDPLLGALGWDKARRKAVGDIFFASADAGALHTTHAIPSLKQVFLRTRVAVLLRDPVARAYADLARVVVEEGGGMDVEEGGGMDVEGGGAEYRAARPLLLALMHACARRVACSSPFATGNPYPHGSSWDESAWAESGQGGVRACIVAGLEESSSDSTLGRFVASLIHHGEAAGVLQPVALALCLASSIGPGAVSDWSVAYRRWIAGAAVYGKSRDALSCPGTGDAAPEPSPSWVAESSAMWSSIPYATVRQALGCVPAVLRGYGEGTARVWPGGLAWEPSDESMLSAIEAAVQELAPCTAAVLPDQALPAPADLLSRVASGLEVAVGSVTVSLPKDAPLPAAVILDGGTKGTHGQPCFAHGTDVPGLGAALARSAYLRPLQRVRAADGPSPVLLLDSEDLVTGRGTTSLPTIYSTLNVYVPDYDVDAAKMWSSQNIREDSPAWRGEEAEFDLSVGRDMSPDVREALEAALDPHMRALAAYAGLPQPDKGVRVAWADLLPALLKRHKGPVKE